MNAHSKINVLCSYRWIIKQIPDATAYSNSYFGDHLLPAGMYFRCYGNESSLSTCQSSTTTCDFANTAGVYCAGDVITGTYVIITCMRIHVL